MTVDFKNLNINHLNPQTLFEGKVVEFIKEWFSDSETVKVQTSGSTGTPKIFEIEKEKMINSAKMTCDFLGVKESNKALLCLPLEYISGKMMVVRAIVKGLTLIVNTPSNKPLEILEDNIDFCALTPLQVENSLDKIHLIKNLIIGGAAVSENLKKRIQKQSENFHSDFRIYETYGMSETLSHIALKEIYPREESCFTTFKGVDISLDARGCLKIFAPQLNSEILQTNDLVELQNERTFRFLGRADNIINSGGAKIFPEQIEHIVKKEIANEVVALGIPDEILGQKLLLVIEGSEDNHLRNKVLNIPFAKSFHKPKGIIFVEQIPKTPNGKVDRHKLLSLI